MKKGQFYDERGKMRTISCRKITFGRRIFIAFDFKPVQLNIYTADKPQLTAAETRKDNVFTTTIAFLIVCSNSLRFSLTQSVTEKISRSRHL